MGSRRVYMISSSSMPLFIWNVCHFWQFFLRQYSFINSINLYSCWTLAAVSWFLHPLNKFLGQKEIRKRRDESGWRTGSFPALQQSFSLSLSLSLCSNSSERKNNELQLDFLSSNWAPYKKTCRVQFFALAIKNFSVNKARLIYQVLYRHKLRQC